MEVEEICQFYVYILIQRNDKLITGIQRGIRHMVKAYDVINNFTDVSAGRIIFAGYIPKGISGSNGYCVCIAVS